MDKQTRKLEDKTMIFPHSKMPITSLFSSPCGILRSYALGTHTHTHTHTQLTTSDNTPAALRRVVFSLLVSCKKPALLPFLGNRAGFFSGMATGGFYSREERDAR